MPYSERTQSRRARKLTPSSPRARVKRLALVSAVVTVLGVLYALFMKLTGFGIPCVFRLVTGLKCPGCGVSRMCLALLELDFKAAFAANPAVFLMIVPGAAVAVSLGVGYIREGTVRPDRFASVTLWVMIAVLVAFGVLRNIPF